MLGICPEHAHMTPRTSQKQSELDQKLEPTVPGPLVLEPKVPGPLVVEPKVLGPLVLKPKVPGSLVLEPKVPGPWDP